MIRALVFDAYGTLFDVGSVTAEAEAEFPGRGAELSQRWRAKQLEYTWLRGLMGRYVDFDQVTLDSLRSACAHLGLTLDAGTEALLADGYRVLQTFPEVPATLERLAAELPIAILSNGTRDTIGAAVAHAGLSELFADRILSADAIPTFKPDPRVYALAVDTTGLTPAEVGFVSSNAWDIAGAGSFGFTTFWVNRLGAPPEQLGIVPHHTVTSLSELPDSLSSANRAGNGDFGTVR